MGGCASSEEEVSDRSATSKESKKREKKHQQNESSEEKRPSTETSGNETTASPKEESPNKNRQTSKGDQSPNTDTSERKTNPLKIRSDPGETDNNALEKSGSGKRRKHESSSSSKSREERDRSTSASNDRERSSTRLNASSVESKNKSSHDMKSDLPVPMPTAEEPNMGASKLSDVASKGITSSPAVVTIKTSSSSSSSKKDRKPPPEIHGFPITKHYDGKGILVTSLIQSRSKVDTVARWVDRVRKFRDKETGYPNPQAQNRHKGQRSPSIGSMGAHTDRSVSPSMESRSSMSLTGHGYSTPGMSSRRVPDGDSMALHDGSIQADRSFSMAETTSNQRL